MSLNSWQHVAISYDSTSASNDPRIFINGVEQTVSTDRNPSGTPRSDAGINLTLGNYSQNPIRTFDGRIDEFRASSVESSADEIAADYQSVATAFVSSSGVETGPGGVLDNDSDPDSDDLGALLVTGPDHHAGFSLATDDSFNYVHDGSETTTDSFTYQVNDGQGGMATTTVTITINPQNDAPTDISVSNLTVDENLAGATIGSVSTTDLDPSDTHTYTVDDTRFEIVSGQLRLRAGQSLDFESEPTVPVTITTTDSAAVFFNKSFTVSVNDQNEAPTVSLSQTSATLSENADTSSATTLATITVNDDALGSNTVALSGADAASFELAGGGNELRLRAGVVLDFETKPVFNVTVTVDDSSVGATPDDSVDFTLTISDFDESPVVTTSAGVAAFTEDAGPVALDPALIVTDPKDTTLASAEVRFDSGFVSAEDVLQFTNQSGISGSYNTTSGVLTLSGTASVAAYEAALRSVSYENSSQNPNTGNRVVRFTVNDGANVASATRTLTVTAQDDPAHVVPGGPYTVAEGSSVVLDGSTSSDVDNFIVEYAWDFDYDGVTFASDATGNSVTFSAVAVDGPDTRTVALRTRSDNGVFALATTTVTISNVAPTAVNDSGVSFTTDENTVFITGNVLTNDTDPGPESLTVSNLDTTGTIGLVTSRGDGTFDYDPNGQFESLAVGQSANDTFTHTVSDGTVTDVATVTIVISGTNDAPVVSDQAVNIGENAALNSLVATAMASDVDSGNSVTWSIVSGDPNGAFTIDALSGAIRVAKPLEIDFETTPNYALTVQATDQHGGVGTGTISVQINDLNEAPDSTPDTYSTNDGTITATAATGVLANDQDVDGDSLTALLTSGPSNGSLVLQSDGSFDYVADLGFTGVDSFTYQAFDGAVVGPVRTVTLNIAGALAPPPVVEPLPEPTIEIESESESESDSASESEEATTETTEPASPNPSTTDSDDDDRPVGEDPGSDSNDDEQTIGPAVARIDDSLMAFFSTGAEELELRETASGRTATRQDDISEQSATKIDVDFRDSLRFDGEDLSYLVGTEFIQDLEQIEEEFEFEGTAPEWAAGTAVATTASISVGYIMWMLRGGYVLASVLSTMPVWQNIDPLPVLAALDAADADDDESLESMIDQASNEADSFETSTTDGSASDAERKDEIV